MIKIILLLLFSITAHAGVIDYGPPSDALGHWEFDLYDASGNQRGTSTNPLYFSTTGLSTSALQTTENGYLSTIATNTTSPLSVASVDGAKATYSAAIVNVAITSSNSTDIFTITGSATKTIRILRIGFTGAQTTSGQRDVSLIKRSTADTGSPIAVVVVPHDTNNAAGTATVSYYATTLPTLGTTVGLVRSARLFFSGIAADSDNYFWDFGTRPGQAIVLRGTSQQLAINLNGVSAGGSVVDINVEWSEE